MPGVEALTPGIIWTMIYGLLALCVLFMIVYKVYEAILKIIERRKQKIEARTPDFADKVSQKVIEKLEPRFEEIERKLEKDKERLNKHDLTINEIERNQRDLHNGVVAMCKFMLVLSSYGNFGDSEKVKDAVNELNKYLAEQI